TTTAAKVFFSGGLPTLAAGTGTGTQTGIVPFVSASSYTNPSSLATYDAVNGLQAIPFSNTTYFTQVGSSAALLAATNQNVTINTVATYDLGGGSLTVNALTNQTSG